MSLSFRFLNPLIYWRFACRKWWQARYNLELFRKEESARFEKAGFDRRRALAELNRQLEAMALPPFDQCGDMASVHWLLFACLSQSKSIGRILEIGTFDGQTTALLAKLFPAAEIVTLDLPETDPILAGTYDYSRGGDERLRAFEQRLRYNTSAPNVRLLRANSFFIPAVVQDKFDLIWIDGGHLYPEIAWDLCNAYHLLRSGGILMCDDVIPNPKGIRDAYVSPDSHAILSYITERTKDTLQLFLKRESPDWSADPRSRKFVALLQKNRDPGT